jgi:hypothetical protein
MKRDGRRSGGAREARKRDAIDPSPALRLEDVTDSHLTENSLNFIED